MEFSYMNLCSFKLKHTLFTDKAEYGVSPLM